MRACAKPRFLRTTELPVKTIAGKIGYKSRSNFSRAFKAIYGVDPNAYRHGAEVDGGAETAEVPEMV
ncbi:MAG: helix-turn-helix domain-containing protein [Kiloniellales bacterium]